MTDLRTALLRIIGDEPGPHEDPYERCRQIAADALGYQAPAPMQANYLMVSLRMAALNPRAWNRCRQEPQDAENVELVPHGELMALKERDAARAEVIRLNQTVEQLLSWNDKHIAEKASIADELASLRRRVAERDASIVNAVRTGKAFRHV